MTLKFDLRGGRRLHLGRPAGGFVLGGRVDILDISARSLGIEHDFPLTLGSSTFLEFSWGDKAIRLSCRVARTRPVKGRQGFYRTGLEIDRDNSAGGAVYAKLVEAALKKLREAEAKLPSVI
jgi:hypothetical protein